MKIFCGLGNPGREYERHRHNIGFHVIDALADMLGVPLDHEKFDADLGQGALGTERVLLLKPQTFMNLSGKSLVAAVRFYKIEPQDTLVIHDELDLPLGRLQVKAGGGSGGHNGIKSIVAAWGEDGFARLRLGIGKPEGGKDRTSGHVLSGFSGDEQQTAQDLVKRAVEAARVWAREGVGPAMNQFNRRSP
jgi:peptidyl-tRNA hydrolase, PTH1 family